MTDEMLRAAAAEANQAILDSLPLPKDCVHQFSPQFQRKMKRIIRRERHPVAYKFFQAAACFLAAVILTGTTWLTVDVEAREIFVAWVRQQYENIVEYRFAGTAPDEEMLTSFAPTWLPDGYEETEAQSAGGTSIRIYSNSGGQVIHFMYSAGADATSLFLLSDQITTEEVVVGAQKADFYKDADPQKANALVWQSEFGDILYCITATLPKSDMVKIAESVGAVGNNTGN